MHFSSIGTNVDISRVTGDIYGCFLLGMQECKAVAARISKMPRRPSARGRKIAETRKEMGKALVWFESSVFMRCARTLPTVPPFPTGINHGMLAVVQLAMCSTISSVRFDLEITAAASPSKVNWMLPRCERTGCSSICSRCLFFTVFPRSLHWTLSQPDDRLNQFRNFLPRAKHFNFVTTISFFNCNYLNKTLIYISICLNFLIKFIF